jgi:pimeloyl-ACP methyl ester carboxylesterase
LAPDLPGMGQDRTPLRNVNLDVWGRFIADLIADQSENVILVGHSRGGIVISQAAEYVPERVRALVYVAAMLVPGGRTQGDISSLLPRDISFLTLSADGVELTVDLAQVKAIAFNKTPSEEADRAIAQFGPEPAACFTWPVRVSEGRYGRVPRVYIETAHDNAIPLKLQRIMQESLPCQRVITMDSDHSPSHSAPMELAAHLDFIAASAIGMATSVV